MTTLGFTYTPQPWMRKAACTTVNPEIFFPPNASHAHHAFAIAVCQACPVINDCLNYALTERIDEGIFGGLTGPERHQLRRRNRRRRTA